LVLDILFDQRLMLFDFREPTDEFFILGLFTVDGSPGFGGTWVSSLEALSGRGGIWSDPITLAWQGGGGGFGWGAQGINLTDHQGSFTGIRWTTQLTSANEGAPMTLGSFSGVTMSTDGIKTASQFLNPGLSVCLESALSCSDGDSAYATWGGVRAGPVRDSLVFSRTARAN
jgi:hypothetical protein